MGYWTDKVVMITGASSGIGKGIALEVASRGANVALLARREELLQEIVSEARARNVKGVSAAADVRDVKAVREAADRFRKELGPIDMLIANAGIGTADHATRLTPEHAANVIGINVLGAVNSVTAVLPGMVERGQGRLVAISSLAAYRGLAKSGAYCASKAALTSYFESLRIDLRHTGVGVSVIHPGFIKTDLTAGRHSKMPYLMELDYGVKKIVWAIEREKKTYAFPWQLATIVRACMLMPATMYDRFAEKNSFRE